MRSCLYLAFVISTFLLFQSTPSHLNAGTRMLVFLGTAGVVVVMSMLAHAFEGGERESPAHGPVAECKTM